MRPPPPLWKDSRFRNLGSSALAGLAVRAAGGLPWAVLRGVYTRIGASEGIVNVFLFEHGTDSPGIATPDEFAEVINKHGARAHFDGLEPERFPHDIGTLGRYGRVFDQLPRARRPWSALPVGDALRRLAESGLSITKTA
jgi:hypothetical protein